jgi:NAD(P)-dependent dehydrogenase (short-subunit alcohol dehydrogenase family)
VGLTKAAALELAPEHIRVNAVAPGFIRTPLLAHLPEEELAAIAGLHPMERLGEPEEIARMVAFLAGDDASFVTGSVHHADGGYTAR